VAIADGAHCGPCAEETEMAFQAGSGDATDSRTSIARIAGLAIVLASGCTSSGLTQLRAPWSAASDAGPSVVPDSSLETSAAPSSGPDSPRDAAVQSEPVPIAGSDFVRGRATVTIDAPAAQARRVLLDFEKYPEFMPNWTGSRILGRARDGTLDVYQEMKILAGSVRLWARVKVPKATVASGVETITGQYVEGNVEAYEPVWKLRPIDDAHCELTGEFLLKPKFFVPTSWMNSKTVEAASDAVLAVKHRVEGTPAS
jgi:ribosome-associated toxin RatA of RatAB toxin-antitoxin module